MGETKNRKVQIKQRQSLVDAFRLRSGVKNLSMNEAANQAIQEYVKKGGENIVAEKDRRMLLLLPESLYSNLSELAKAQGMSVNRAIESAMEAYIVGEQTDNATNRLTYYISRSGQLSGQLNSIVSTVNQSSGSMGATMGRINDLREKKVPKSKEKEKYEKILTEVDTLWSEIEKLRDKVNELDQGADSKN